MSKPRQKIRVNVRKVYEKHFNVRLPDGIEVHHVLPIRLGGTNDVSNLIALSLEKHKQAHLDLYAKYGDYRDLCAYHLIGGNFSEAQKIAASNGGKAAAKMFKETGRPQGFQSFDAEFQRKCASDGGKIGGKKQVELGMGIHAQTKEERLAFCSMGGKSSVEINGWKDSKVQSENGKRGGVKNKGFKWYNDGISMYKYTAKQQEIESFELFIARTGNKKGRFSMVKS